MKVCIFGAGTVEQSNDSKWLSKSSLAAYFKDLTDHAERVRWLAKKNVYDSSPKYSSKLAIDNLEVLPLCNRKAAWPRHNWVAHKEALGASFLAFMPNALRLYPVFGALQRRSVRFGVYLANDFQSYAKYSGFNRLPGGWRFYIHVHRKAIKLADFILARGQKLANVASSINDNVYQTVPLGHMKLHDEVSESNCINIDRPVKILYVGKILESKGIKELFHAYYKLSDRYSSTSFRLLIVGDGPFKQRVEQLAKELSINEQVSFTGWIDSRRTLEKYWKRADVLVMPSSTHSEGVPRVIDEALNRKIPVVASAIGGVPQEYTANEVYLVTPGDVSELTHGIERVIFDKQLRTELIKSGIERIETWRKYGSAGHQHGKLLTQNCDDIV
jgi:glycosyltransferase involved in cell wall biosynthesis